MNDRAESIIKGSYTYRIVEAVERRSRDWLASSLLGRFSDWVGGQLRQSLVVRSVTMVGAPAGVMEGSLIVKALTSLLRLLGRLFSFMVPWLERTWQGSLLSKFVSYESGIGFLLIYLPLQLWVTTFLPYAVKYAAEATLYGMFAVLLFQIATGQKKLRWTALDGPVLIFLTISIISAVMNQNGLLQSIAGMRMMFQYYLLAFIVSNAGLESRRLHKMLIALVGLVTLLGLVGIAQWVLKVETPEQWVDVTETYIQTRAFGTMQNPNTFAGYLGVFAAPLIALWTTRLSPTARTVVTTALVAVLGAIAFTYSRSGWFALAAAILIVGVVRDRRVLVVLLLGCLALPIVSPNLAARVAQGFSADYYQKSSSGGRIDSWTKAVQIAELNPLFGVGPGQFGGAAANLFGAKAQLLVGLPERQPLWVDSQFFQYIAEVGYLGLLAFVWLIATFLRSARDLYRKVDEQTGALVLGFAAAIVGVIVQSVFASMWETQQITSVAWFGMSLVCTLQAEIRHKSRADSASKRLRILHLVNYPGSAGTETYMASLCRGMITRGHSIVLGYSEPGLLVDTFRQMGVETFQVPMRHPFDWAAVRQIARLMREQRIEVVHTHFLRENFLAIMAAKLAGVPVVVNTVHMIEPKRRSVALFNRLLTVGCDRVIAVSEAVRHLLVGEGLPRRRLDMIYAGIDLSLFQTQPTAQLRVEFGAGENDLLLGCVGRLSPEKGHGDLLEAAAQVLKEAPTVRFVIVGDGPLRSRLAAQAESLGVAHAIHFAGFRRDMPAVLSSIDLAVMPSHSEALGLAILEAMAAGRPVVATSVGGIPEVVEHGRTGLLVPPASPDKLAEAILQLAQRPAERALMGAAGKKAVAERFDIDTMVQTVEGLYHEIYQQKRPLEA